MSQPARVAVSCTSPGLSEAAAELAERLRLPLLAETSDHQGLLLRMGASGLELVATGRGAPGAVRVDFSRLDYRRHSGSLRKEAVARAVGLKGGQPLAVLDATAGLGQDGFMLAALGADVVLVERSPIVAALLADGLRRAAEDPELAGTAARLRLVIGEARDYLDGLAEEQRPEVVYLDPMYPEDGTKGQVKKEMQLLRQLLGPDRDTEGLLAVALTRARRRVVVKRPRRAPVLGPPKPSHQVEGRSTRFDVYIPHRAPGAPDA